MKFLALIALLLSAAFIDAKSLSKDDAKNDKNENEDGIADAPVLALQPTGEPPATTVGATTPDATTPDAATTAGATSAGAATAGATSDVPADAIDDVVVGRVKRHRPSWRRRSYWRNRWHRNQWWNNRWSTWTGWYDSNVWNNYDWSHVSWDDHDRDHDDHDRYYHGRHYRSATADASENQEKTNEQVPTDETKNTDKPTTPTLPVNITAPVTDLPTTPTPPATLPVNITSDTNPPATGNHDDAVGRDKRYFFIYPTWSRRAYWRNRLMSSRWWSPWWASWDGWYDIGVWDTYNWAGLDWWGDFYYSIGGRYYRSASNAVGFQLIEEAKTWAEAAEFCAVKRMCLATLSTEEQKDAAADISSDMSYWIGGHLDTSITPVGWRWINGQPVSEAPLVKIDPTVPLRLCLVAEGGFHLADRCDETKPFLCQSRC